MAGKRGKPLDPRMPANTQPSTQKISSACGRKVDTCLLPLIISNFQSNGFSIQERVACCLGVATSVEREKNLFE